MEKQLILFCGGLFRDFSTLVPRFPEPGETITASDFLLGFGGKSANQAVMCKLLGAEVAMVGCVGDDDHGRAYQANFERRGIDTSGLRIAPGESTGVASIFVDTTTGENKIAVFFGANEFMTKERVEQQRSLFRQAKIVSCSLEMNREGIAASLRIAKECGATTILNAAPPKKDISDLLEHTDILVVNETEAAAMTGLPTSTINEAMEACKALQSSCPTVIVTLGAAGAVSVDNSQGEPKLVQTDKIDSIVDTTGAGDAFVGALAFFLHYKDSSLSTTTVVSRACRVASQTVKKQGTQSSYPSRDELPEELLT